MSPFTVVLAVTLNASPAAPPSPEAPVGPEAVREAAVRSLDFVEKAGVAWVSKSCVSCHHGPFMLWSHHEAQKRGFAINQKSLDLVQSRSVKDYGNHPKFKPTGMDALNDMSTNTIYLILSLNAATGINEETAAALDKFAAHLIEKQQPNGAWHVFIKARQATKEGLMQPIFDRDDVTTSWALLGALGPRAEGRFPEALANARIRD